MKQLRILTGAHSGAQVRLVPGNYRLGHDDEASICITDWDEGGIWLQVDDAGVARWCNVVGDSAESTEPTVTLVPDLVPVPFGDIVLCIGPEDAAWPADVDLLRMLWIKPEASPQPGAARRPSQRAIGLALGGGMVGALLVVAATLFGARPSEADATPSPSTLAARVDAALHGAGLVDLQVRQRGNSVAVLGMVPTAAEDVAARGVFERIAHDQSRILRQYDVAEDDRRNLQDALGVQGIHVNYRGAGVFEVAGTVPSMTQFQSALTRVKTDLDPNIKRIDVAVNETPVTAESAEYSSIIAIGDVRYVETPDGVKHVFPGTAAPKAAGTSKLASERAASRASRMN